MMALFGSLTLIGQTVEEREMNMSLGKQVGFSIDIDGADLDVTKDIWKKFTKEIGKSKRNKKAREHYIVGETVPMIAGATSLDLYMSFDERIGQTTASLWVDLGGEFINSNGHPKEAAGTEDFLKEFYLRVKEEVIQREMKEQEKVLSKLEKAQIKLQKKNKGYHNDIEKAKEKIEKAEKNIEQNLRDQDDQTIQIEQQKKLLEEIIERLNNLDRE